MSEGCGLQSQDTVLPDVLQIGKRTASEKEWKHWPGEEHGPVTLSSNRLRNCSLGCHVPAARTGSY